MFLYYGTTYLESKSVEPLLEMIQTNKYDVVHGSITAKRLMTSGNPLSLAIQVSPFMIFSLWKCVYSYKFLNLHFFFRF